MNCISFHNVKSIEVTETQLREAHFNDGEHYGARDITITTDQGVTVITVFSDDASDSNEVLEALGVTYKYR